MEPGKSIVRWCSSPAVRTRSLFPGQLSAPMPGTYYDYIGSSESLRRAVGRKAGLSFQTGKRITLRVVCSPVKQLRQCPQCIVTALSNRNPFAAQLATAGLSSRTGKRITVATWRVMRRVAEVRLARERKLVASIVHCAGSTRIRGKGGWPQRATGTPGYLLRCTGSLLCEGCR